ncbi:cellulase family glycosylhydrolase [candidate division KSB1 bacterium]|nr:cellulase family glycosylhydrolase [candidate division KSB1 bacterium]
MRVKIIFHAVIFLLFSSSQLLAQNHKLIYDQLRKPQDAVYHHVPLGLCEDYPEETTTLEIIRNDMEVLKRSGINLLRISFGWDSIEERKDEYNWLFWDDYVKMAVDEYGITLIPYICYTPQWNSTGDTSNFWNHTPKDYEEFGEFVGILVNRYKDRIKTWELWNEPDIKAYWSGTAEDLARIVKIGAEAVRKADSTAIVVCPGLAGHTEFTLALFKDYGISPYVDVVNLHNYFETWHPSPIEAIVPYVNDVANIIKQYGDNQSLWMAEVGYSTFRRNGYVSDWATAYYDYEHTPEFQAVQLIRTLALLLSTEKLAAIAWYEIKDLPPGDEVIGDVNNRHLGVTYVDYKPKPAEAALSFFNKLFAQKHRCIDTQVAIKRPNDSDSEVHSFENEDGSVIVVGWLRTKVSGKQSDDKSGNVKDTRKESIALTLPMKLAGKATLYDELGNAREFTSIERQAGSTTLKNVALVGGEIAIIKITK